MFSHIDPSKEGSSAITAETVIQSQNQTPTPIQWDPTYIKSLPGVLKICSMIFGFIVIICVFIDAEIFWYIPLHAREWAQFVSVTGFLGTGLLLGFYLFHIIEKLSKVPWIMIEMGFCILWSFLYLTVGLDFIVKGTKLARTKTDDFLTFGTSFFCFCGVIVYGIDGFLKFKGWKEGRNGMAQRDLRTI